MLDDSDIDILNKIYKVIVLSPSSLHSSLDKAGIDLDKLDEFMLLGFFDEREINSYISSVYPTPEIKIYLTDHTRYYVTMKLEERRKKCKERERIAHNFDYKYERHPWLGDKLNRNGGKDICPKCFVVNVPCDCGVDTIRLPPSARVPRKNASKTKWKTFKLRFDLL